MFCYIPPFLRGSLVWFKLLCLSSFKSWDLHFGFLYFLPLEYFENIKYFFLILATTL